MYAFFEKLQRSPIQADERQKTETVMTDAKRWSCCCCDWRWYWKCLWNENASFQLNPKIVLWMYVIRYMRAKWIQIDISSGFDCFSLMVEWGLRINDIIWIFMYWELGKTTLSIDGHGEKKARKTFQFSIWNWFFPLNVGSDKSVPFFVMPSINIIFR